MSRCVHHDARCVAARRLREDPAEHAFAFGDATQVVIARGARARAPLAAGPAWPDAVDAFLAPGRPAYGYLGFELQGHRPGSPPAGLLVEPEHLEEVGGTDDAPGTCHCGSHSTRTARDHDRGDAQAWCAGAEEALAWVRSGPSRRLTLARRVELPGDLDPLDVLGLAAPDPRCRDVYLRTPGVSLGGQSPELLADGTVEGFDTWKVSGTVPAGSSPAEREAQLARLRESPELAAEHEGGVRATEATLAHLGACARRPRDVLALPELAHLLTVLHTRPRAGTSVGACLAAVHPSGAAPRASGLALVARHEPFARGPYYGLVGLVRADGRFSFAQALRLVLRDETGVHAWAGAAVTPASTVQGELEETRVKLGAIRLPGPPTAA